MDLDIVLLPFKFPFMQKAFTISLIVAIPTALLSCFLVVKGWALMGDAVSHSVLPGVVIAYIFGLPLIIGAFATGMMCATATGYLSDRCRVKKDSIIKNQIGFEIIGSNKEKEDDKKIIETSLKSLSKLNYRSGSLILGNVEIFKLLINKLDIPKRWRLRLLRHYWRESYFNVLLKRLETNSDVDPTIVEIDKKKYQKMLKQDQSRQIAGRSLNEILTRFNNKIKDPRRAKKGRNVSKIIKEFLKINCPINQAPNKLNIFFKKYKINIRVQNNYFPVTKNKLAKLNVKFSASFGRQLEYYTGLVFRIDIIQKSKNLNIINGGRYDNLLSDLGSAKKTPAVGAALNLNY